MIENLEKMIMETHDSTIRQEATNSQALAKITKIEVSVSEHEARLAAVERDIAPIRKIRTKGGLAFWTATLTLIPLLVTYSWLMVVSWVKKHFS